MYSHLLHQKWRYLPTERGLCHQVRSFPSSSYLINQYMRSSMLDVESIFLNLLKNEMIIIAERSARSSAKCRGVVPTLRESQLRLTRPSGERRETTWPQSGTLRLSRSVSTSATWQGIQANRYVSFRDRAKISDCKMLSIETGRSDTVLGMSTTQRTILIFGTRRFVTWKNLLMVLLMLHSWRPGSLFTFVPLHNTVRITLQLGKIFGVFRFI